MNGRKLQLNRETLRTLSTQEMSGVAGGAVLKHGTCTCGTCLCSNACPKASYTCPAPKMALMIR
jgi:hypothetical protein